MMILNIQRNLAGELVVGDGVGVADVDGAVGEDGAEEGADDPDGLVGAPDVAVADVEDHQRVDPRGQARRRGREVQRRGLARRHGGGAAAANLSPIDLLP